MSEIIEPVRPPVAALRVMQAGAIAVVLASATLHDFELDRFFVPKELALHLTALLAGLLAFRAIGRIGLTRTDYFLLGALALTAISAVLSTNGWLAMRGLAINASALLIFWVARALRDAGLSRPLLVALVMAIVLAAITALLQTYGVEILLFSESRAPGGTLGNRNFVAHVAAFGLPVLILIAVSAMSTGAYVAGSIGVAVVTASLVLTRSRAAWLAFAAVILVFVLAMFFSPALRRDGRTWRRFAGMLVIVAAGVAAALLIPNTLQWNSDNPYVESVTRVADYQEGSGRGRLIQYERSMLMAVRHPLLGVGPGNWAVEYPAHAARNDPSLSGDDAGMTNNPWPSSDWVAWIAERGFAAALLTALAFLAIAAHAVRQLVRAQDVGEAIRATALAATIAGAIVTGLFDAVLLLALPALIIWAALGVLWQGEQTTKPMRPVLVVALLSFAALGAIRSSMQIVAMTIYTTRGDRASLSRAAVIDPGNYRLRLRLARGGSRNQRCDDARAAHALFPHAAAAAAASRGCANLNDER